MRLKTHEWEPCNYYDNIQTFFSVTIHYVDKKFLRHDVVLASFGMDERKTGDNIASRIEECLESNRFSIKKLSCLVRDAAPNIVSTCAILDVDRFI